MGSPTSKSLPSASSGRLIDAYAGLISDPAQKLRFLNAVFKRYEDASHLYKSSDSFQGTVITQIIMDELKSVRPDVTREANALIRAGKVPAPSGVKWHVYRFRNAILGCMVAAVLLGVGTGVAALKRMTPEVDLALKMPVQTLMEVARSETNKEDHRGLEDQKGSRALGDGSWAPVAPCGEALSALDETNAVSPDAVDMKGSEIYRPELAAEMPASDVLSMTRDRIQEEEKTIDEFMDKAIWLVEEDSESELYSNGLRILTSYTIENEPRSYYRFSRGADTLPSDGDVTDKIVGILYHASESDMIDFKPEQNDSLNRYSKALVRYIRKRKSYNYFIDRFGRIYRIVRDDHAAYHAGWSVWADRELVYLNLNHAFIGICFEGKDFEQMKEGSDGARISPVGGATMINEGQLTSGRKLTDWLRVKYEIGQHNCVTHGLASVNPHKMLIGYHLDLVRGFPFERFGLKDKTKVQLPALTDCGFSYDDHFMQIFNGDLWDGIAYSEDYVRHRADIAGMSHGEYRQVLADRFAKWFELYRDLHG